MGTDRTPIDERRITDFFSEVVNWSPLPHHGEWDRPVLFIVTHLLKDRPFFLEALAQIGDIGCVYAKPKTRNFETEGRLRSAYNIEGADRQEFGEAESVLSRFKQHLDVRRQAILLDIGGYFAPSLPGIAEGLSGRLLGVVEDTENGEQRYRDLGDALPCPVYSVARSPLKETEDTLVGEAVLHSGEHLIRSVGHIMNGKEAAVFGFGKIGRSVARALHARNVGVVIVDTDPVRQVQAMALGYRCMDKVNALRAADIVIGATGNFSLRREDYPRLKNGAFIFTVTSSDDELEMASEDYKCRNVAEYVDRFETTGAYFYLLNKGNAVNFIHDAVVGDYIYLVQAEILQSVKILASAGGPAKLQDVGPKIRSKVAEAWLKWIGRIPTTILP